MKKFEGKNGKTVNFLVKSLYMKRFFMPFLNKSEKVEKMEKCVF